MEPTSEPFTELRPLLKLTTAQLDGRTVRIEELPGYPPCRCMFYTMYSECTHTSASVVMESVFKLETGTGQRVTWYGIFACCTTHAHTYSVHTQNTLPSDNTEYTARRIPQGIPTHLLIKHQNLLFRVAGSRPVQPPLLHRRQPFPEFCASTPTAFPQLRQIRPLDLSRSTGYYYYYCY